MHVVVSKLSVVVHFLIQCYQFINFGKARLAYMVTYMPFERKLLLTLISLLYAVVKE